MAYATIEQLTESLGHTPNNAQQLLDRASRDINRALVTAVYDTTDATIIAALQTATIEQVAWHLEAGNDKGIRHDQLSGIPSGGGSAGVSLSRSGTPPRSLYGEGAPHAPVIGEQVWATLQAAGLTAWGPIPT